MLDPVKLRVLRSVVETGSIRASAEALGYTPSAVSQQLSALRREAGGLELITRTGRGITVTPAGRTLAAQAETVLDALADLERTARDLREGHTGTITFAYASSAAATWVPSIARDVREAFPDLALSLVLRHCSLGDQDDQRGDVVIGDDIATAFGAGWIVQDILEEGYVALVGDQHPFAARSSVALSELEHEAWVTDDDPATPWFDRIASSCRAAGFSPRIAVNPPDFAAVLGFVASGDYVSVQPSLIAQDLRPGVTSLPLDPPAPRRRLQVRVRERVASNPAVQFMVERVRATAAAYADQVPGVRAL